MVESFIEGERKFCKQARAHISPLWCKCLNSYLISSSIETLVLAFAIDILAYPNTIIELLRQAPPSNLGRTSVIRPSIESSRLRTRAMWALLALFAD